MSHDWETVEARTCSELTLWAKCPKLWEYTYKAKRRPLRGPSSALAIGTGFHEAAQRAMTEETFNWYEEFGWYAVMREQWTNAGLEDDTTAFRTMKALSTFAAGWFKEADKPWDKVLGVEEVLERRGQGRMVDGIPRSFYLRGRLDAIVERGGRPWLLEWKTLAATTPVGVFLRGFKRSLQAGLYPWLAEPKDGEIPGWVLIVVRKLPLHDKSGAQRTWEQAVEVIEMPVNTVLRARAIREATRVDQQCIAYSRKDKRNIRYIEQRGRMPGLCTGQHGNSLCGFVDVCDEVADLDDTLLFEAIEPNARYEGEATE